MRSARTVNGVTRCSVLSGVYNRKKRLLTESWKSLEKKEDSLNEKDQELLQTKIQAGRVDPKANYRTGAHIRPID